MSFGGFNFGKPAAPAASTSAPATGTLPTFSLTGATPNPTPGATQPPAQPFSFGNPAPTSNNAAAPAAGGGLFGSQPAKPATGGLFGGLGSTTTAQQPGTTTGGGLFGNLNQSQPQQQQQQQAGTGATGGLFGGFGAKPAATGATGTQPGGGMLGGSLFGGQQQQQQQQQSYGQSQPQTSLFGQSTNQQPSTGLFGQQSTSTQPQQTGLFGSTNQPQQQLGGLQGSTSSAPAKPAKFTDLPEASQKMIEQLDSALRSLHGEGSGSQSEVLGQAIRQTSIDIRVAAEEHLANAQTIASLEKAVIQLNAQMEEEIENLKAEGQIIGIIKTTDARSIGASNINREFPQQYFKKIANKSEERVLNYRETLNQLQRAVRSLRDSNDAPTSHGIAKTIHNHQNAILSLAAKLEQLHYRLEGLRNVYTDRWQEQHHTVRSPFDVAREQQQRQAA